MKWKNVFRAGAMLNFSAAMIGALLGQFDRAAFFMAAAIFVLLLARDQA